MLGQPWMRSKELDVSLWTLFNLNGFCFFSLDIWGMHISEEVADDIVALRGLGTVMNDMVLLTTMDLLSR